MPPEAVAGAIAIAVAAARASQAREQGAPIAAGDFCEQVLARVPEGKTHAGIVQVLDMSAEATVLEVAEAVGCGRRVSCPDDAYYDRQERLSYVDLSAALTTLKQQQETMWLDEVSSVPVQQALRHLETAFRIVFAGRAKYPTLHKKRGAQSATSAGTAFRWDAAQRTLTLAKMATPLHIHWSRPLPEGATPSTVTVSRDTAGRYFVSIQLEEDSAPMPVTAGRVGIDLGLRDVVELDTGEKVGNPRYFTKDETRLAKVGESTGVVWPRSYAAPRTATRRVVKSHAFMPALPTVAVISRTNSRPASSVRTKRFASRACV
jgi:hypothetical protein